MPLKAKQIRALQNDLGKVNDVVRSVFASVRASDISSIARDLSQISNAIEDTITNLGKLEIRLEEEGDQESAEIDD